MPCDNYHEHIRNIYQLHMILCDSILLAKDEDSKQKQQKLLDDLITLHGVDTHHYLHPCTRILKSETLHQLLIMLRAHMTMSVLLFNILAMC